MVASGVFDMQGDDHGLAACLKAAHVQDNWRSLFVTKHGLETLGDFVYMVDQSQWEASLKDLVEQVNELRDSRLVLARFKAAYQAGLAAVQSVQTTSSKVDPPDAEEAIPEGQFQQLSQDWSRAYGLTIEAHLDPADALRAHVWREMRRRTMTVIEIKKVKSVVGGSMPLDEERINLEHGVTLQFAKDTTVPPKSAAEYYFRLRTLCNAWAWAGNFKAKCL